MKNILRFRNLFPDLEPHQRSVHYCYIYGLILVAIEIFLPHDISYISFILFGITVPGFGAYKIIRNSDYKDPIAGIFLVAFSLSPIFWLLNISSDFGLISLSQNRFLLFALSQGILSSLIGYLYIIKLEKLVEHHGCSVDIVFITLLTISPVLWVTINEFIVDESYNLQELIAVSISSILGLHLIICSLILIFLYPNSMRFWFLLTMCGMGISLHSLILNFNYFEGRGYFFIERSDIYWLLDLSVLFSVVFMSGQFHKKRFDSLKVNLKIQYRLAWIASITPSSIPLQFVIFEYLGLVELSSWFLIWVILASVALIGIRVSGLVNMSARYHRKLTHLATTDSLTGALNRRGIMQVIASDISAADYIVVSDINEFKSINDYHGHPAGDEVLKKLTLELNQLQRQGVVHAFGRTGGDEFIALLKAEEFELEAKVISITKTLSGWMDIADYQVLYSVSVGVAKVRSFSIDEAIKNADQALYVAKRSESEKFVIYRGSQYQSRQETRELIQISLDKDTIDSMLQPIFEPENFRCVGAEILMRLSDKTGEFISTEQFIPLARQHGLIDKMMHSMLVARLEEISKLPNDFFITINISPATLASAARFEKMLQTLNCLPMERNNIVLELTEDRFVEIDALIEPVKRLSALGYKVALDDFGIGDSSLARAAVLPIDIIKLDRKLIDGTNSRKKHVLTSTMNLSKKLAAIRIVEGVESETQHQQALDIGADLLQGFYYSEPLGWSTFFDQYVNPTRTQALLSSVKK